MPPFKASLFAVAALAAAPAFSPAQAQGLPGGAYEACFTRAMAGYKDADFPTPFDARIKALEAQRDDLGNQMSAAPSNAVANKMMSVTNELTPLVVEADTQRQKAKEAKADAACKAKPPARKPAAKK